MPLIAHNLIRGTINQAAHAHSVPPDGLSFKGTVATIRQWAPLLAATTMSPRDRT